MRNDLRKNIAYVIDRKQEVIRKKEIMAVYFSVDGELIY